MEKKEALIKCSDCGASYKLKIPVTDKPLRFKCKKCGKNLTIRIKTPPEQQAPVPQPEETALDFGMLPGIETTQLPDTPEFHQGTAPPPPRQPSVVEGTEQASGQVTADRRWLVLSNEQVKGPFSDDEISAMIKSGEIEPDTSMRMGQRPWIRANQVPWFRDLFGREQSAPRPARPTVRHEEDEQPANAPFYQELGKILPYPFRAGTWQPLAIFLGIAFAVFAALAFEFIVGLPVSIIGWTVLYGYLAALVQASMKSPDEPPPAWDFSNVKDLVSGGIKVLLVLAICCLIPTVICLLVMITCVLNGMEMLGYIFLVITIVVYAASLFVAPAGLVVLEKTQSLGVTLSPSRLLALIKKGDKPYLMLAAVSIVFGLACLLVTFAALFLVGFNEFAFIAVALLMAAVFTYGHFVWFHILGRYSRENPTITSGLAPQQLRS
jgi:hypothetical protein